LSRRFVALLVFTGLREVSAALSNPFGEDDLDFPIDEYMHAIRNIATNMSGVASRPLDRGHKPILIHTGTPDAQVCTSCA